MQIEITDATYGTKTCTNSHGVSIAYKTGIAVARVTIDGETRAFTARLAMAVDGYEVWETESGMAAVYPTGGKVHNVGLAVSVCAKRGMGFNLRAGRSSMYARRSPRCVGFFNDCANAASPKYRR